MDYQNPSTSTAMSDSATTAAVLGFMGMYLLISLVVSVVIAIALWKIFTKAGKPGWAAIVPFYNMYVLNQIVGRPDWFFWAALGSVLLSFIGIPAFVVFTLIWSIDLAKSFGRSTAFGVVGLFLFSFVGFPMLGFGKDKYVGPAAAAGAKPAAPAEAPAATPPAAPPAA